MSKLRYGNRTALVIPLLLAAILLFGFMGIKVNAASNVSMKTTSSFTYNEEAKSLTGWVISKAPDQIVIDIQYDGDKKESYTQIQSMILLGYDDGNVKYYKVYYQLPLSADPVSVKVIDGDTKELSSESSDDYVKYTYEENLYVSMDRIEVTTYELGSTIFANTNLYSFPVTVEGIDGMEVDFFRDIDHEEINAADFVLVDAQTGETINVEWVLPIYTLDEVAKTKTAAANGLQIKFTKGLEKNHAYTLMTSGTADGKEFVSGENQKSRIRVGTFYQTRNEILEESLWNLRVVNSSKELTVATPGGSTSPGESTTPGGSTSSGETTTPGGTASSGGSSTSGGTTTPSESNSSNGSNAPVVTGNSPKTSDNTVIFWALIALSAGAAVVLIRVYQSKKEDKI